MTQNTDDRMFVKQTDNFFSISKFFQNYSYKLQRLTSIIHKTNERGLSWFLKRLKRELFIPGTILGEKIKPFNKAIYNLLNPSHVRNNTNSITSIDTLYLFYDLEVSPITFDLCWVLCLTELERKKRNLKFIKIIFVPGTVDGLREEIPDYDKIIDQNARHWRRYHLLFPLTHLLPSCIGFNSCNTREEAALLTYESSIESYPNKYHTIFPEFLIPNLISKIDEPDFMALRSTAQALIYIKQWLTDRIDDRKLITITLRNYDYMPKRNSNTIAWATFAKNLDPSKYFVVIIPDVEKALSKPSPLFDGFTHFNEVCWNVELRSALYESSYLNLGINNGPFALCWLNKNCNYIMFKIITDGVPQVSAESFQKIGYTCGQPPQFAHKYQRWVWGDDNLDIIQQEFDQMCLLLEEPIQ